MKAIPTFQEILDGIRVRAAHLGISVRPAESSGDVGTHAEAEALDDAGSSTEHAESKGPGYTSTTTLFLRVTQGKQGVLQVHQDGLFGNKVAAVCCIPCQT